MIAIDTQVLVRHPTRDDPEQAARAHALFQSAEVVASMTVAMQTERVLRSTYRYTRRQIAMAFDAIADSEGVVVERADNLLEAAALRSGLDFADARPLAGCATTQFETFDTELQTRASAPFARLEVITP